MSSLKSIAQQAVVNAGLENQIPPSSHSPSSNTKGKTPTIVVIFTVQSLYNEPQYNVDVAPKLCLPWNIAK